MMRKLLITVLSLGLALCAFSAAGCGDGGSDGAKTADGSGYFVERPAVDYSKKITGRTYYVSRSEGNDQNDGLSAGSAVKTLSRASEIELAPGDGILLKRGDVWTGETFAPKGSGTFEKPVVIYSYGERSERPVIKAGGIDRACVYLNGNDGIIVAGLELAESYQGILVEYQGDRALGNDYLHLENLYVRDILTTFNSDPWTYNHCSTAIRIAGNVDIDAESREMLTNFVMRDIRIFNADCGFFGVAKIGYEYVDDYDYGQITNFLIENVSAKLCGQWSYSFMFFNDGVMKNIDSFYSGQNPGQFGTCAYLTLANKNVLIDRIYIDGHYRSQAQNYDAAGFDFEGINENVTLRNFTIKNIDGPSIMIFDNGGGKDNLDLLITDGLIENYGLNDAVRGNGPEGAGILFIGNSNGKISNCTFNTVRDPETTKQFKEMNLGAMSRFVFENNTLNAKTPVWFYGFDGGLKNTMNFGKGYINYKGNEQIVGSTCDSVTAREGSLIADFGDESQYLMSGDDIRCPLGRVSTMTLRIKNESSAPKLRIEYGYDTNASVNSFEYGVSAGDSEYKTYVIDLAEVMGATKRGNMKWFKIYLVGGTGRVCTDYIEIK